MKGGSAPAALGKTGGVPEDVVLEVTSLMDHIQNEVNGLFREQVVELRKVHFPVIYFL